MRKFTGITILLLSGLLFAQQPGGIPSDTGTIDMRDTSDLIIYVVIPIALVILYLVWRKRKKNDTE